MVKAVDGAALMWYNLNARGLTNPAALHAACPVEEGVKHAMNHWVYTKPFRTAPAQWLDEHPRLDTIQGKGRARARSGAAADVDERPAVTFRNRLNEAVEVSRV